MEALGLRNLFAGAYAGRRVLITGHTGFKGSWLTLWLQALGADVSGLALDPETRPSHWDLLGLELSHDFRLDLADGEGVARAVETIAPEVIFHLAAQPFVRRSYREPVRTFASNVTGLVHVLEAVRACPSVRVIVNATTDKVYEPHDTAGGYTESDPLGGHDPYSTSKTCAELISTCYRRSYFDNDDAHGRTVKLATARAGNVIGGGDWGEDRLVPDLVRAVTMGQALQIRSPTATRPWQHVLDPLSGYLRLGQLLLQTRLEGDAWNFGPDPAATLAVGDVVERLHATWPALNVSITPGPHPHEAAQLRLDCRKAARDLRWHAVWDASATLARTAAWYRVFLEQGHVASRDDLIAFVDAARAGGQEWTR